jgi:hypothetical protein
MGVDPDGGLCCGGLLEVGTTAAEAARTGAEALSASIRAQGFLLPSVVVLSPARSIGRTTTIFPEIADAVIVRPSKAIANHVSTFFGGLAYLVTGERPKIWTTEGTVEFGSAESYEITKASSEAIGNEVLYAASGEIIGEGVRVYRVIRQAGKVHAVAAAEIQVAEATAANGGAQIGTKLEYVFGKATGSVHNIERSKGMLKQLKSVGIFDNAEGRSLLKSHLESVFNSTEGILQSNGRYLRESLLMGPNGGLKVESIWEGNRLITVKLLGGKII